MSDCFLAWRIYWSESGYRGWDHQLYMRWLRNRAIGTHQYVREHGFGHEWWNFYEGFSKEFYYGYAPPIHSRKPTRCSRFGAIFFVSLNPLNGVWYLVGVYGEAELLNEQELGIRPIDYVSEEYRRWLAEQTKLELGRDHGLFLLKAPKKYSTVLPRPMPLNMEEDLGIRFFGQAWFKYLKADQALTLLEKAIGYVRRLASEGAGQSYWADTSEALERLTRLYTELSGTLPPEPVEETEEAIEGAGIEEVLVSERVVEDAIARDLGIVEDGLELVSRSRGKIVARGRDGALVIIEVSAGRADDQTLTQLLAHMVAAKAEGNERVRGYIVARDFSRRLREAVKALDNVGLIPIGIEVRVFRRGPA